MKVIGFNFKKISSERIEITERPSINTNIEFTEIDKEKVDLLKEMESLRVEFKCSWVYSAPEKKDSPKQGEISFEGSVILAVEKEESKEILKAWKKKKLSPNFQAGLFNLILRRCTSKAVFLAEEIALPSPLPLPKIKLQTNNN